MTIQIRRPVDVLLTQVHPRDFNPNVMSDEKFNMLADKMDDEDFTDPIKAYPATADDLVTHPEWEGEGPHYWILAGEHRWRVAKVKEMEAIPCILYDDKDWDIESQKLRMVRDNLIHGELDSKKFTELAASIDPSLDIDPKQFGFADAIEMGKYLIQDKEDRDKSFLDGFRESADTKRVAVDSLSDIVANIFAQCAETVDQSYLHFTHKGNVHCVVLCKDTTRKQVDEMLTRLNATGGDINPFIEEAIRNQLIQSVGQSVPSS